MPGKGLAKSFATTDDKSPTAMITHSGHVTKRLSYRFGMVANKLVFHRERLLNLTLIRLLFESTKK
jgi:hypothetical protein